MVPEADIIPGHGGFDPGAVNNANGVRESDGNLGVGLKLKKLLEFNGIGGNMSRVTDVAVWGAKNQKDDVNWQIAFANQSSADIAAAIHFNSSTNKSARGVEVLYSQYPSYDKNEILLANLVLAELVSATGLVNRGVKQVDSGIGVIKKVYKPTILIECAFVSNDSESIWCSDEAHQLILARAIAKGICKYFGVEYKEEGSSEEMKIVVEAPDINVIMNGKPVDKTVLLTVDGRDTTYIPAVALRDVGINVKWDEASKTVVITK